MVHASSIKELDEGKEAKALMVIEIGFPERLPIGPPGFEATTRPLVSNGAPAPICLIGNHKFKTWRSQRRTLGAGI